VIRGPVSLTADEIAVLREWGSSDLVSWAARAAISDSAEPARQAAAAWSSDALNRLLAASAADVASASRRSAAIPLLAAQLRPRALCRRGPPELAAASGVLVIDP
jgi:hypothetical protein